MPAVIDLILETPSDLTLDLGNTEELSLDVGERKAVGNYNELINKPSIENVVLSGNKTLKQIGVGTVTPQEIDKLIYG